jgi:isochorismate synthase
MENIELQNRITNHFKSKLPFVVYCLPEAEIITGYFQKNDESYSADCFSEDAVIMAPFECKNETTCIPFSKSEVITARFSLQNVLQDDINIAECEEDYTKHIKLVDTAKKCINNRIASKIVVSRRKEVSLKNFDLATLFIRLINLFPDTFRYIWYHPKTGLWCGASPELLLKTEGLSFKTMALAGTKKINSKRPPDWTTKEIQEQQYVLDDIIRVLQKITGVVKASKTFTHQSGSIAHLRTDITGVLKNQKATLEIISKKLHPTPAVCGIPMKIARDFILSNEGYEREYYTGYIGPVAKDGSDSQLFVNLRCIKISDSKAYLYVGGGITEGSDAEEEWKETKNKLQTMLQVLRPFL